MKRTRKIVEEFGMAGGLGEKLQKQLEKRATMHDNWVSAVFVSMRTHGFVWL